MQELRVNDLRGSHAPHVKVISKDGRVIDLYDYVVSAEFISGRGWEQHRFGSRPFAGKLPLSGVLRIEKRRGNSSLLFITAGAAAAALAFLLLIDDQDPTPPIIFREIQ